LDHRHRGEGREDCKNHREAASHRSSRQRQRRRALVEVVFAPKIDLAFKFEIGVFLEAAHKPIRDILKSDVG